ncbi:MAG: prepilin-type N-terminal cleavage/methylation domain-containing protein [Oscillospiraceae bacterium]
MKDLKNSEKKPKKVKGITLIECIISMLVLGVAGLIMAEVGSVASKIMIDTNHLNNKTDAEAPVALVRDDNWKDKTGAPLVSDGSVTITVDGPAGGSSSHVVQKYSTEAVAADSDLNTDTQMSGNLEFYVFATEPST